MESICAVIDAQGFYINNEFMPRELAVAAMDGTEIQTWESCIPFRFEDLSESDQKLNDFVMKYTGLRWECRGFPIDKIKLLIAMTYHKLSSEEKPNFGVKNHQFAAYLASIGIPYIEIKCPSTYTLTKLYGGEPCIRHLIPGMCSVMKVDILRKWLFDYLEPYEINI